MSLNKLTTSTDYLQKQFLNIGCNDIKCTTLEVGGAPVGGSSEGRFTPTITVDEGSTIDSQKGLYTTTGSNTQSILDVSIQCQMVAASSTTAYRFTVTLPDGWKCFGTDIAGQGTILCKGATADTYICEDCTSVADATTATIKLNVNGTTYIPVGVGTNFVNFSFKVLVKK